MRPIHCAEEGCGGVVPPERIINLQGLNYCPAHYNGPACAHPECVAYWGETGEAYCAHSEPPSDETDPTLCECGDGTCGGCPGVWEA